MAIELCGDEERGAVGELVGLPYERLYSHRLGHWNLGLGWLRDLRRDKMGLSHVRRSDNSSGNKDDNSSDIALGLSISTVSNERLAQLLCRHWVKVTGLL